MKQEVVTGFLETAYTIRAMFGAMLTVDLPLMMKFGVGCYEVRFASLVRIFTQ